MNNTLTKFTVGTVFIHSLVFCLPFLVLITNFGVGLCSVGFLIVALYHWRRATPALLPHVTEIRGVLIAFGIFLLLAAVAVAGPDGRTRNLEKPLRMLLAASAMLTVLVCRPSRKALWWGLIAGAFAGAAFIAYQRWGLGLERPGGLINAITFGDLMLCMGLLCLAGTLDFAGRAAVWPGLGALAGLLGSVATGTRGGWVAIVFSLLLLVRYGHVLRGRLRKGLALVGLGLLVSTYFIPQTGARDRLDQGISDVRQYVDGEQRYTNVGVRIELWRTALHVIERNPLTGASERDVRRQLEHMVETGQSRPFVLEFEHFHNDIIQQLVYGGVIGLLAWLATLVVPFLFFLRQMRHPGLAAPALAGMLLTLCYFSFGLTEVIFWSVRAAMFYALMLFVLIGFCLDGRPMSPPARTAP
ncbi:O-antigen ligase family protein [Burkholderia sp. LMU1-1-1.1]|uniref:O-antigen ligase family protein n=1 Tax=Burkholderia sp. LMU1-1-1.1 TaxID=3135266 RepID=UPI0034475B41